MRIAHLSDLHWRRRLPGTSELPQRLSRRMPELLGRAVALLQDHSPDLLILSGDLLDYPLEALDDAATRAPALADLRDIASLLRAFPCPQIVIPGNHDHRALMEEVFPPECDDRRCDGYRALAFRDHEGAEHWPLRVGAQRRRFEAALADAGSPPQIHVQHYLVWPERTQSYPHSYCDAAALRDAIVGSGLVRLVLSGHYHAGVAPFCEGHTWFATVPAFCEHPHPLWIYTLDEERLTYQEIAHA